MTLNLVFAVLTLATVAVLLAPILRRRAPVATTGVSYDVAVYRDQLAEVERDVARGLLTKEEAAAARLEVSRRMLAVTETGANSCADSLVWRRVAAVIVMLVVPLGAWGLYGYLGSPNLPAKPYAERQNDPDMRMAAEAAIYQKIIDQTGGDATTWSALGENLTIMQNGLVGAEARQAFVEALRRNPHDSRAQFYLGMAAAQKPDVRRAVAIWRDLEARSAPDAPWVPMVQKHIAALSAEGGFDPATIPPVPPSLDDADAKLAPPAGPQAAAIMAMKPEDQQTMIRSMVDRLAAKMQANPNDREGWLRLEKAYRVLGDTTKADEARRHVQILPPS